MHGVVRLSVSFFFFFFFVFLDISDCKQEIKKFCDCHQQKMFLAVIQDWLMLRNFKFGMEVAISIICNFFEKVDILNEKNNTASPNKPRTNIYILLKFR